MIRDSTVHALGELVKRSERRSSDVNGLFGRSTRVGGGGSQYPTRALPRFVDALRGHPGPVVVDLGPALGANVSFLGDELGCKLHVEDVLSSLEVWGPPPPASDDAQSLERDQKKIRQEAERRRQALAKVRVLPRETGSVDGVLCWDVIDHLEPDAATALAREVTRVLTPGGVAFLCHGADSSRAGQTMQYEIVDDMTLRYRRGPADRPARRVWQSRAILQMFGDLTVTDSFLLTSRMREIVLRKPSAPLAPE